MPLMVWQKCEILHQKGIWYYSRCRGEIPFSDQKWILFGPAFREPSENYLADSFPERGWVPPNQQTFSGIKKFCKGVGETPKFCHGYRKKKNTITCQKSFSLIENGYFWACHSRRHPRWCDIWRRWEDLPVFFTSQKVYWWPLFWHHFLLQKVIF